MIALPYSFDTAATWRTIMRGVLAGVVIALLLAGAGLVAGKVAAAAFLVIVIAFAGLVSTRTRGFPMGAAGTISATAVTTVPVTAYGLPLNVPVGRFPIADFQSIRFESRLVSSSTAGLRRVVNVYLVGRGSTPEIQVATVYGDAGESVASELGTLLHLPVAETQPPGTKQVRIKL